MKFINQSIGVHMIILRKMADMSCMDLIGLKMFMEFGALVGLGGRFSVDVQKI